VTLDPRRHAVRPDLADIRLAEHVFAPRYAAPVDQTIGRAVALRAAPGEDAEVLTMLTPGARFELLDLAGGEGWGIAVADDLVGYVEAAVLTPA
jgi:hypothetical protein